MLNQASASDTSIFVNLALFKVKLTSDSILINHGL